MKKSEKKTANRDTRREYGKTEEYKMTDYKFKAAAPEDAAALLEIYSPYVRETAITFEYDVPSEEEFAGRIRSILQRYPYIIAETGGKIAGYAYVSPFNSRPAYDWAVETSVYVARDFRGKGAGSALYAKLEEILRAMNIVNLEACIAYASEEDETLTNDSMRFHKALGYRLAGHFCQCGYKFHRWYDMIWMEKIIGPHSIPMPPVRTFDQVREEFGL